MNSFAPSIFSFRLIRSFAVLIVCCLSGCSGSSNQVQQPVDQSEGQNSNNTTEPPNEVVAVKGLILIEENNGKRVFNAFFTPNSESDNPDQAFWSDDDRACYDSQLSIIAHESNDESLSSIPTLFAGSSIEFHDRGGKYLTLESQSLGDTVVYSSDIRWTDTELPQGTVVSLSENEWFAHSADIELFPLQQMELLEPDNALLAPDSRAVLWVSGENSSDRIRLVVSAPYAHEVNQGAELTTGGGIYCDLPDNGSFELPISALDRLGTTDSLHVSASRRRVSELSDSGSVLSVLQISNSQ
ncbi:MAG: hypothetical protein AB8B79_05630 [Granulosicoccus sp.]